MIGEYDGSQAPSGGGVYEAFLAAGEQAANPAGHSVIGGTAPAGRVLRLRKQFTTATSQAGVVVPDALDSTLTVPASGRYTWHVNPSKRPLFAEFERGVDHDLRGRLGPGPGHGAGERGARGPAPPRTSPATAPLRRGRRPPRAPSTTGRISAKGLERARLGRKQSTVRTAFARGRRTKGAIDRFCLAGGGAVRVGYPSAALRRKLSRRERARVKGRAVLLLSSSPRTRLRGVVPGVSTRTLLRRIGKVRPVAVGSTRWYLRARLRRPARLPRHRGQGARGRPGRRAQTASRTRAKRLFASFR